MAQTQSYPAILNSQLAVDDTIIITDTSGPYTIKKLTFTELDKRFVTKSGNSTIVGDLTATNFIGDGSGLTGIASGTGGIINTGSTTIGADSDADGVGVNVLQTRGITRLTVENDGDITIENNLKVNGLLESDTNLGFDCDTEYNGNELLESKTILDQQIAPYYHFDGTTNKITLLTNDQLNFNYTDLSILVEFAFKTIGNALIVDKRAGTGNGYQIYGDTNSYLNCSVDFGTNYIVSSDETISVNTKHGLIMRVDRDGNLSMVIDGVIQSNVTDISGSYGSSMFTSQDLIFGLSELAASPFNGDLSRIVMFNRLLTDDEAISYSSNPLKAIDWIDEGGSNIAQNVSNCVNDDYTIFGSGTPTGFNATSNGTGTHDAGTADEIVFIKGKQYRVEFDLVLNSGTAPIYGIYGALAGSRVSVESDALAAAGRNVAIFTCNTSTTGVCQFYNVSTATDFEVTNLSVTQIGATLNLKPQDITEDFWFDSSGNDNHGAVTGAKVGNRSRQLYEEKGTWTPANGDFGTWTSPTFTATYTKQGSKITGQLTQTGGTIDPGAVTKYITGLPYTPKYSVSGSVTNGAYTDLGICSILTDGKIYFSDNLGSQTALKFSFTYETEE